MILFNVRTILLIFSYYFNEFILNSYFSSPLLILSSLEFAVYVHNTFDKEAPKVW